jgi:MFS family permease
METSNPAPPPFPATMPVSSYTLKQEWLLIAAAVAVVSTLLTIDMVTFPRETGRGERTPLSFVAVLVAAFSHAAWISMDRKRRGLTVGIWRFGAVLLGPVVIGIYLLAEYRVRALYLIPAMLGIYLSIGIIALAVSELLAR